MEEIAGRLTGMNRPNEDELSENALQHAWNWFALHASQRMQSFNFFLIATAFLVAAYGAVLERHRPVALAIGILGAWISFWFNRLEGRTKQLVKAGEAALEPLQDRLAYRDWEHQDLAGNRAKGARELIILESNQCDSVDYLVDCFAAPRYAGGLEEVMESGRAMAVLDLEVLGAYLDLLGQRRLFAILGFFLGQQAERLFVPSTFLGRLERKRPASKVYLDQHQRGGRLVRRWNLVVPERWVSASDAGERV